MHDIERFIAIALTALSWDATITSVLAGLSFGFLVFGMTLAELSRQVSAAATARYGKGTVVSAMLLGWVFFAPTIITAIVSDDTLWPRVVVRLGYWSLFCVWLGAGMYLRVLVDGWVLRRRKRDKNKPG